MFFVYRGFAHRADFPGAQGWNDLLAFFFPHANSKSESCQVLQVIWPVQEYVVTVKTSACAVKTKLQGAGA